MRFFLRFFILFVSFLVGVTVEAASFRTVVIDAGHGGQDLGGQWGQVYEKHLALDTAMRLEANLNQMGYKTVMLRRGDYFLTLGQRAEIANRYKNAIFVSIHYNYTWKQQVSGLETFYYNTEGQRLAQSVQNCLAAHTGTINRNAKFARFYVIRNSKLPSILVESGFVSNATERNRMKSASFRESIAHNIAEGIRRYGKGY
jgi:N-acetylmuramoyl-L-alanine amidase